MTKKQDKKYKILSLFSGCGGLDLGLEGGFSFLGSEYSKNPFEVIWANDINTKASQTQALNFPHTKVVCADITKLLGIEDEEDKELTLFKEDITLPEASLDRKSVV